MNGKRLVVKVGTNTLTDAESHIDIAFVSSLAKQVKELKDAGWSVVIVTSGAIAAGVDELGMTSRPTDIPTLQATAAAGQVALIDAYAQALKEQGITAAQVLLTRHDTSDRHTYLHARTTLTRLLELGAVPVINENDTVAIEEIAFGDNDTLAALVGTLVDATLVIILSDVDGLYTDNPRNNPDAQKIEKLTAITPEIVEMAKGTGTKLGSGGMVTKIRAARVLLASGIRMILCDGRAKDALIKATQGDLACTYFEPADSKGLNHRKRWIALGDAAQGTLTIDDGAVHALQSRGTSLLSAGVLSVEGDFEAGTPVAIMDNAGMVIARGISGYSSSEIEQVLGAHSDEVERVLPHRKGTPIVHCDDMALL